jgi:hypothetical protein
MSCVGFSRASISTGQSGRLSDGATFLIHITAQNRLFGQTIFKNFHRDRSGSDVKINDRRNPQRFPRTSKVCDNRSSQNFVIRRKMPRSVAERRDSSQNVVIRRKMS